MVAVTEHVKGVENPNQVDFLRAGRSISSYAADIELYGTEEDAEYLFEALQEVIRDANTMLNFCKQHHSGRAAKRDREEISDSEGDARKASKIPRPEASKKRSRDDEDKDDKDDSRPSKAQRVPASNKRARGEDNDGSEDGSNSKKPRLGIDTMNATEAKEFFNQMLGLKSGK